MTDALAGLIAQAGYGTIFLLMLLETVFPPVPSELIMSVAGTRTAGPHALSLPLVIAAGTSGAMLGNLAWYGLARWLGIDRMRPFIQRHGRLLTIGARDIDRADRHFEQRGRWFVFLGRMVPTMRSLVSVPAGLFAMPLGPFLFWSTLGTAGWTGALAVAGNVLGRQAGRIDDWLGPASIVVILLLLAGYLYRVLTWKGR